MREMTPHTISHSSVLIGREALTSSHPRTVVTCRCHAVFHTSLRTWGVATIVVIGDDHV